MADNILVGHNRVREGEYGHLSFTLATPDLNLGKRDCSLFLLVVLHNIDVSESSNLCLRELNPSDTVNPSTCAQLSEDEGSLPANRTEGNQVGLAEEDAAVRQGSNHPPR